MNCKIILSFLFLCIGLRITNIIAQETNNGYVHLRIYDFEKPLCKIDEIILKTNDTLLSLTPGKHPLKIWSPTLALIDTSVQVKSGDTVKYSFSMQYAPAYIKYKNEYDSCRQLRNKRMFVSPIWMGLTIGIGIFVNKYYAEKQYNNAMRSIGIYSGTGNQSLMDKQKSDFDLYKKKYNHYKKIEYGIYSFAGVLALNYVRIIIKQRKVVVPVYREEKLLSRINFNLYPALENKSWLCGLSMNF